MTPEQRQELEKQMQDDFGKIQQDLASLKNELSQESDETKKQEKEENIKQLESSLNDIQTLIEKIKELNDEDLQSLKEKINSTLNLTKETRWDVESLAQTRELTPTTYELLKDSETCNRLRDIIAQNPNEFKTVPWETAEKKLEYIFQKIRKDVVLLLKNKLWESASFDKIINNTIAPALERNLMELLRDQWNEANVWMLNQMDKISWDSLNKLLKWVSKFAKATTSFQQFDCWMNALDYLSIQKDVLYTAEKSEILTNPLKFQEFLRNPIFASEDFSPFTSISPSQRKTLLWIDYSQNFEFWINLLDKQKILQEVWHIQVAPNPKTTALIAWMLDKPEQFLDKAPELQKSVNVALDMIDNVNWVTKNFWVNILDEVSKAPAERWFLYKILDFVCKLLWFSWGLEWIVKKRRLDRMKLDENKVVSINDIMHDYQDKSGDNHQITISDQNSCLATLNEFRLTDPKETSTTRWDFLRDSMMENVNLESLSPVLVQSTLWDSFLERQEYTDKNWKKQSKIVVKTSMIDEEQKQILIQKHITNMTQYLAKYSDLSNFYKDIHTIDDLAVCMTTSLYCNQNDVIEWIKAQVFMPENYRKLTPFDSTQNVSQVSSETWLSTVENVAENQVSEQYMYDKAIEYWVTDKRQIAYILATAKWESWFKNIKEIWWEDQDYWKDWYYGRWFVQLTHKENYEKFTKIINESGIKFKDNAWNEMSNMDLVMDPDLILQSKDLAAFILIYWMKNWTFTWQKLDDYINTEKVDFYNARRIINDKNSKPNEYKWYADEYLKKLW